MRNGKTIHALLLRSGYRFFLGLSFPALDSGLHMNKQHTIPEDLVQKTNYETEQSAAAS